jgi:hypothetical protein
MYTYTVSNHTGTYEIPRNLISRYVISKRSDIDSLEAQAKQNGRATSVIKSGNLFTVSYLEKPCRQA